MLMRKDIYLFEKVIFKDFKYSVVTNIHSHKELWHTELKIQFPNTFRSIKNHQHRTHLWHEQKNEFLTILPILKQENISMLYLP